MKTTVDIPELLYRQAKIRAVEQGSSLKELLVRGLQRELRAAGGIAEDGTRRVPYFARRKLLPTFIHFQSAGAFRPKAGNRDVTDLISDDRDGH